MWDNTHQKALRHCNFSISTCARSTYHVLGTHSRTLHAAKSANGRASKGVSAKPGPLGNAPDGVIYSSAQTLIDTRREPTQYGTALAGPPRNFKNVITRQLLKVVGLRHQPT